MEAINYVNSLQLGLTGVIIALAGFRVTYCYFKSSFSPDESGDLKKTAKNTLVAAAILLSLSGFIAAVRGITGPAVPLNTSPDTVIIGTSDNR